MQSVSSRTQQHGGQWVGLLLHLLGMSLGVSIMLLIALYEHQLKNVFGDEEHWAWWLIQVPKYVGLFLNLRFVACRWSDGLRKLWKYLLLTSEHLIEQQAQYFFGSISLQSNSESESQITCFIATNQLKQASMLHFNTKESSVKCLPLLGGFLLEVFHFQAVQWWLLLPSLLWISPKLCHLFVTCYRFFCSYVISSV